MTAYPSVFASIPMMDLLWWFFYEPFYEPFCGIRCVVSDFFYDIGAVVEIPEGYVELGGVGTELWAWHSFNDSNLAYSPRIFFIPLPRRSIRSRRLRKSAGRDCDVWTGRKAGSTAESGGRQSFLPVNILPSGRRRCQCGSRCRVLGSRGE